MPQQKTFIKLELIKNNGEDYLVVPDGMKLYAINNLMGHIVLLQVFDTFTDYPKELEDIMLDEKH